MYANYRELTMKLITLTLLMLALTACSGGNSSSGEDDMGIELADAVEFNDSETTDVVADTSVESMEPSSNMDFADSSPMPELGTDQRTYTVKKNETLMMIAFNVYGDYRRWKDIANLNQDVLSGSQIIREGMQLKYMAPAQEFVFSPSGNPYLIQSGDTLGKISDTTYGTEKHWKDIWNNNKPLIRNPNVIFAGFTIYTPVIDGRDVAFDSL
jgi:LysM repeat protein